MDPLTRERFAPTQTPTRVDARVRVRAVVWRDPVTGAEKILHPRDISIIFDQTSPEQTRATLAMLASIGLLGEPA